MHIPGAMARSPYRRQFPTAFTAFLALVILFFVGILVFVYVATKRANPVMLDQNGRPLTESLEPTGQSGAH